MTGNRARGMTGNRAPGMTGNRAPGLRPASMAAAVSVLPAVAAVLAVLAAVLAAVAAMLPATADAAAGSGTAHFGGGGGGGGGFGGGGGGFGGGGHGKGFALYVVFRLILDLALLGHGLGLLVLVALGLLYWFFTRMLPKLRDAAEARRQRGHAQGRQARRRERRVELAAAEAADEDPAFDPARVRADAAALFTAVQQAWDAGDRQALQTLLAPALRAEWERRLDDFERRSWRNRVELLEPPKVEFVGLTRRPNDRVVVRVEARLRDYVVDAAGRRVKRRGQFTQTVRMREFWTLERIGESYRLASIEQGAEGAHALRDRIVQTAWADDAGLRDEAMLEQAAAETVPAGTRIAELADLGFAGDARAAANDLSLADGRFAPDVLEIAARRAVAAWAEAVDGSDQRLLELADAGAAGELLHPGDPSRRTRLVVRGTEVTQISIVRLDAASEPATMTIDVHIRGRRYLENRDTAQVIAGDPARAVGFVERWTLAVTNDPEMPWRIIDVGSPAPTA